MYVIENKLGAIGYYTINNEYKSLGGYKTAEEKTKPISMTYGLICYEDLNKSATETIIEEDKEKSSKDTSSKTDSQSNSKDTNK